jgi:hypothetical protein
MEETKCLKPSDSGSRIGDRASVQATTRVNAEHLLSGEITFKIGDEVTVGWPGTFAGG